MFRKSRMIASFVVVLGATAFVGAASSQTPAAKLIAYTVSFNGPELNTSTVNLQLHRGNQVVMTFGVTIPHVGSVDEAIGKLRPEIDRLADELKNAPIEKQP